MATIYLHIGTPKTGTSSIQVALADNLGELNKQGITFPDLGFRYEGIRDQRNGHFLIDVDDPEGKDFESAIEQLKEMIPLYEKIILTDESLWNNDRRIPQFVSAMKELGAEVKIVVYFRRQDLYLQSQWAQDVKETMIKDFDKFIDTTKIRVDFYKQACVLADLIGKENLLVRVYERGQFINQDLVTDFFETVGIIRTEKFVEEQTANPSLSGIYLEVKRLLNRTEQFARKGSFVVQHLLDIAEKHGEKASFSKNLYFSSKKQREFLQSCEESNQKLAKEFLGREDGILFYDMIDMNKAAEAEEAAGCETYASRYSKEECADVLAELILMQKETIDAQNAELRALNSKVGSLSAKIGSLNTKIKKQQDLIAELKTPTGYAKHVVNYGKRQLREAGKKIKSAKK